MRKSHGESAAARLLLLLLFAACVSGCSTRHEPALTLQDNEAASRETAEEPPVAASVAQAFFEGGALVVKVHVEAKAELDPRKVAVSVAGLREGDVVAEKTQSLAEAASAEVLEAGQKLVLVFSLEQTDLTEYQVRCSWGADADAVLNGTDTVQKAAALAAQAVPEDKPAPDEEPAVRRAGTFSLKNVTVSTEERSCASPPCEIFHTIKLELANETETPVSGIKLAVGLFWENEGQPAKFPEDGTTVAANEELVSFDSLILPAGSRKKVNIAVNRGVPAVPGGRFLPHVRIVSYLPISPR